MKIFTSVGIKVNARHIGRALALEELAGTAPASIGLSS